MHCLCLALAWHLTAAPLARPQLPAGKVHIAASWGPALQRLLQQVALRLGLKDGAASHMQAHLRGLVLCEPGGSWPLPCGSAALPGSFASLAVQLPCAEGHAGGSMVVQHAGSGRSMRLDSAQVGGLEMLSVRLLLQAAAQHQGCAALQP